MNQDKNEKSTFLNEKEELKEIARKAFQDGHIKSGEKVLVLSDPDVNKVFLNNFITLAHENKTVVKSIIWPYDPTIRSMYDFYSYVPPKPILDALMKADVIYTIMTKNFASWYSYDLFPKIMSTGRIIWIRAIKDYLCRVAGSTVDLKEVRRRGKTLYEKFKKTNKIRVTAPNGTDVVIDGVRNSAAYYYKGEVFKAGEETSWPGGMAYVAFKRESVNGTIVLDGAMKMIGVLKEPIKLTIKKDKIINIEGGKQAKQLTEYIKKLNDPNFPYMVHIGLGTNPGAKTTGNAADLEAVNGTVIWAIGRQQNFFETKEHLYPVKKGMTAKNHFNPTTLNCTLWLDDELILKNGKYVPAELI